MALERSSAGRRALARSIAEICLEDGLTLNEREFALIFDILHKLIRSVEMRVRRDLAQRLASRLDVPRGLIVTLANDQIDVAYPVLVESEILEDADLIAISFGQKASHQIAITLRERVSPAVSEALVGTNNPDVIDSLMRNPTAELAPPTMRRLVDMSRDTPPLRGPLLQRHDLSPELAWRMSHWVGDVLREFITEKFPMQYPDIEPEIGDAVQGALTGGMDTPRDIMARLNEIEAAGGITAKTLVGTLGNDDIELFEAMFARLTGIDPVAMPVIVYDPGGEPFAIACKACGISDREFEQLYLLLIKTLAGEHEADEEELKTIRAFYRNLDDLAARTTVSEWRRVPSKAWETA